MKENREGKQPLMVCLSLATIILITSCGGGGGGSSPPPPSNPVPSITSLSPSSAAVGAAAQTLTINGTNFLSSSTVTYNGTAHTPTFVSSSQLTIPLSASDQATAGTYPVVVTNPSPGGGASNSVNFAVNNPLPTITSLSPSSAAVGAAAQTLTITGTNFLSSAIVTYNGTAHSATFVSSTQLTISLTASDQATAGNYAVIVTNPSPGGGASNSMTFAVDNPQPEAFSLSPSFATAGAAAQTLTITGTNFLSSSSVSYNGTAHSASFVSSTQMTISLSATDQATPGPYALVVTNPSPGGGGSNPVIFTVNSAPPACGAEPQSQSVTAPATATFCVTPPASGSPTYQWYKNGAPINGATSASYTTPPTTWGTNGAAFSVTVTEGSVSTPSSTAILTVYPAPTVNLSPVGPVLIGGQPQSQMVVEGTSATFTATAIGSERITYQWNENGTPISGATSATYVTPPTTSADNGETFTVTVTNPVNSQTSVPATLSVVANPVAPAVVAWPQYVSTSQGNPAFYYVISSGTAPLSYQWMKNGVPIDGATDSTYTTPPTTSADNGAIFTVAVTNGAGTVTSVPAGSTTLNVESITQQQAGLGGFQPLTTLPAIYPGNPGNIIGEQFRFQVVTDTDTGGKIIFGGGEFYTPGQSINGYYDFQMNVYSWAQTFANGGCTTYPPLGTSAMAQASLRNATADYPYQAGLTSAVGSAINTSDPVNWPVQTYLIDNIPDLWKSDSMSQFSMNGLETLVTIQKGATLTDISGFERCGIPMLSTTYRIWTINTQVTGYAAVVNQVIAPDADAQYIWPVEALQIFTESLGKPGGIFTVQYWDFAFMTESNPAWTPITTLTTMYPYDGDGSNFGEHVVSVNGQDRIEISNVTGNSYLPGNLPFAIAPP